MTAAKTGSARFSFPLVAGLVAIFAGSMVLVGWALDIAALKSLIPYWVAVKPNTAVGFILTGLALWLQTCVELKAQVNDLSRQLGQPPPYEMESLEGFVPTSSWIIA